MGDPSDIRNWRRRSDAITTSGRLEAGDPARLAALGVRHVVNLALDDHPEALPDEAEKLAAEGIGYSHIPVPFDAPRREHVAELARVLADTKGPVHVHCIMNWRVTDVFSTCWTSKTAFPNTKRAHAWPRYGIPLPATIRVWRPGRRCSAPEDDRALAVEQNAFFEMQTDGFSQNPAFDIATPCAPA